jgi:hypothetical protein
LPWVNEIGSLVPTERTMDIIKKNLLSIIFGVIALLAVIALFYPIGGIYDEMETVLKKEGGKYTEATQQLNAQRPLPIMPAVGASDSTPQFLTVFPNEKVIGIGKLAVQQVHDQSLALVKAAEDCNIHKQLVDGVLPNVNSTTVFDFQRAYQDQFKTVIPNLLVATAPPTQEEVDAAADDMWKKDYYPQIYYIEGKEANLQEVQAEFNSAKAGLPIQMRDQRAGKFKLYLLPGALSIHPALIRTETPSPQDVWFAQLSLWVEQDVADAIAHSNLDSDSVVHSAVKQLVKLDIAQDPSVYVTEQDLKNGQPGANPNPTTPGSDFAISPSGRVCNSLYDVVHFTLVLNVDATRLPAVLADLERNKLMTVLQVDATSVDSAAALDDGFVFGKDPVVQVSLQCEALFLRSWIDALMPDSVKFLVHGGTPGMPGGPGGPGGGMGPGGPGRFSPGGGRRDE